MLKRFLLVRGAEFALFALLAAIPLTVRSPYALGLLTLLAIYGVLLIGLDVTVGYLGQVNLAQAAFLGIGAYAAAIVTARYGGGIPVALFVAGGLCTVLGALLALPALRLEGPQFALATLSFLALTTTSLNELEWLTNGAQGLSVTRPPILPASLAGWLPGPLGPLAQPMGPRLFFWLCLALLAVVWIFMRNLLGSQWGRAFEALRDSPIATDAMGVGTYRHKVAGFAFGSGLGGLAGALYAFNFEYLQPQTYVYELTVVMLLGVVLGGRKSLWGAMVGAVLVALLPNLLSNRLLFQGFALAGFVTSLAAGVRGLLRRTTRPFQALAPVAATFLLAAGAFAFRRGAAGELQYLLALEDWRKAIFALMLFSVVVGLPEGLMGFATGFLARLFSVAPPPLPPAAPLDEVLPARTPDGAPLLVLDDLKRHFGGVRALDGVSLTVRAGQVHGLIGPNGSGKSTLVNVLSGLYAPGGGSILLRGKPLPSGSLVAAARAGVARTFQNLQLFTGMTALENVMVALRGVYRVPLPLLLVGLGRAEERRAQAAALALLEFVGLGGSARTPARDLTYGDQRFLEIARALARRPELLVLDEPAAGLAQPDVLKQVELIRKVARRGVTIVLIEHHMDVVTELCDAVTALDGGRIIAEGTPAEVKRHPKVIEAYLGGAVDGGEAGPGAVAGEGAPC